MLPKKDVTIGEDTFTIRKLSWRSMDKAREARGITAAVQLRALGGDVLKGLKPETVEEAEKQLKAKRERIEFRTKERYEAHDRGQVLTAGLEGSSRMAANGNISDVIEQLDDEEARKLHEAILDFSLPPLDPAVTEAAEGKL